MLTIQRISIDLDDNNENLAFKTAARILTRKDISSVEVWRSSGGRGFHVIGYLKDRRISFREQIRLRKLYGDCKQRIKYSIIDANLGLESVDVLFTSKVWADGLITHAKKLYTIQKDDGAVVVIHEKRG